ncbi:inositol monophosphatase family protein [Flexibacterium corallicola]|uniref:inositol monophosphatase family protein n=1 Tax=Flexibacterium corallicola TaxID=3037259 RepID=UPI00286EB867|nr:inositol monophosphatase family protein [Pseudovibrio sp. M1P-2-3]
MTTERFEFAVQLAEKAGKFAHEYFKDFTSLNLESKGHQDMVSEADRDTELFVRDALAKAFPNDGIFGEEYEPVEGKTGYTWVIDPIDGTANFVTGIPQWCVIIACVKDGEKEIAAIYDPCHQEMYAARKGAGATLNDKPISVSKSQSLSSGSLGFGFNGRSDSEQTAKAVEALLAKGAIFFRNASGGLMLSYVAAGRLIGYMEEHMNSYDCLAGLLLIEEAGGRVAPLDKNTMIAHGGRITAAAPGIYEDLLAISQQVYK